MIAAPITSPGRFSPRGPLGTLLRPLYPVGERVAIAAPPRTPQKTLFDQRTAGWIDALLPGSFAEESLSNLLLRQARFPGD